MSIGTALCQDPGANPLDPIVHKFAELGYDPDAAFDMLDDNGDGVLTIKEI